MSNMKPQKKLVLWTLLVFVTIIGSGYYINRSTLPDGIHINTKDQPTIGYPRARVHVVVFEEPKCSSCKEYNGAIFPKIKENFIDSNKILYTVIPVSFLPNSMPAANALLSVYNADPSYTNSDLYFTFLDYMYDCGPEEYVDWAKKPKLLEMAQDASPAINLIQLGSDIERDTYRWQIEKNTRYAANIMGGIVSTPTVYVEGIKVDSLTYNEISRIINEVLQRKGVRQ